MILNKPKLPRLVKAGRAIRLLGWADFVITLFLWTLIFILNNRHGPVKNILPTILLCSSISALLSGFLIITGSALMRFRPWSRIAGIFIGVLMSLAFPLGTALGAYLLWCIINGWNEVCANNVMKVKSK